MPRTPGSGNKISCSFAEASNVTEAPDSIVYMPEGTHTICATVNGRAKEVTVKVSSSILASFQAGLDERGKKDVRSITDFDHAGKGAASARPKAFRYEPGRGLMLDLEWTRAGRTGIEGKDYSYFSPNFLLGADGVPTGISKRGPIGSLVNDPAFETIEAIAAARADLDEEIKTQNEMEILQNCGLLTADEAANADHLRIACARVTSLESSASVARVEAAKAVVSILKDAVTAASISDAALANLGIQAAFDDGANVEGIAKQFSTLMIKAAKQDEIIVKAKETEADRFVSASIAEGKIVPKNETLVKFWRERYLENPEGSVEAMNAQPQIAPKITERSIGSATSTPGNSDIVAEADALIAAGSAKTRVEAFGKLMAVEGTFDAYRVSTTIAVPS